MITAAHTHSKPTRRRGRIAAVMALSALCAAAAVFTMPAAWAAGAVEVSFVQPEKFADIGRGSVDRQRNLDVLAAHFKSLGAKLPDGQTLKVEVLDVDLAGELWPMHQWFDQRVLRGSVDWPRMELRYTLQAGGQTVKSGAERIADMAYLMTNARLADQDALAHDRRLVDRWFDDRFGARAVAAK